MNKRIIKTCSIVVLAIIMLFTTFGTICFADDQAQLKEDQKQFGSVTDYINMLINSISFNIFNIAQGGLRDSNAGQVVTIDTLVFDHFSETDINFFNPSINTDSIVGKVKDKVTFWYVRFRQIAISCYLIILLYVGIRIMLAVGGKQQEKYKEMIMFWGQGVVLLLFFPFLLKYIININHAFVGMIEKNTQQALHIQSVTVTADLGSLTNPTAGGNNTTVAAYLDSNPFKDVPDSNYMAVQAARATAAGASIADSIVLLIMVFQFILLLIAYYKRLFMTGFLIAIFPVVMILYPIDKLNDGKSQSFSVWAKETFLNIFTQTFHALAYIFVMAATAVSKEDWILALVGVTFLFKAEEVIKNILGLGGSATVKSPAASMAKAAVAIGAVNKITNTMSSTAEKVVTGSRYMREARTMGYKSFTGIHTKENRDKIRENNVEERFNALSGSPLYSNKYNPGDGAGELTSAAVSGPTEDQAEQMGEILGDADVATFSESGDDALTMTMMAVMNNPSNENLAKQLEKQGLSTNGKASLAVVAAATTEFQNSMLKLDPESADYKTQVKKIKGKFNAKIGVAFPTMNDQAKKNVTHAALKAMRMGAGIGNNKNFDLNENRKALDDKMKMISGKNAVIDNDNVRQRRAESGMGLFAQEDYKDQDGEVRLFGYAKQMETKYYEALSKDEKFQKLEVSERKSMAKDLAILATTREQSKLSSEELKDNFMAIRGKTKNARSRAEQIQKEAKTGVSQAVAVQGGAKRQFTMNNTMQMFTAKTTLEAAERLQAVNTTKLDGALDGLMREGVGKEKLAENKENLGDDTLGFGADMEEVLAIVDNMVVQETQTPINEDNPQMLLTSMGVFEEKLEGEERTAETDQIRRDFAVKANKENKSVLRRSRERQKIKDDKSRRTKKIVRPKLDKDGKQIVERVEDPLTGVIMEIPQVEEVYEMTYYVQSTTKMTIEQALLIQNQTYERGEVEGATLDPIKVFNAQEEATRHKLERAGLGAQVQAEAANARNNLGTSMDVPSSGGAQNTYVDGPASSASIDFLNELESRSQTVGVSGGATSSGTGRATGDTSSGRRQESTASRVMGGDSSSRSTTGGSATSGSTPSGATPRRPGDYVEGTASQNLGNYTPGKSAEGQGDFQKGDYGSASTKDFWMDTDLVHIREEKERKLVSGLDFLLGQSDENTLDMPDEPTVNGYTKEEYIKKAKDLQKQGRQKFAEALNDVGIAALSGVTLGPMAIGLNTGENAAAEWLAGTTVGMVGGEKITHEGGKPQKIKAKDADGVVYEIVINKYSETAGILNSVRPDGSGVYRLDDLISADGGRGVVEVTRQVQNQKAAMMRTKEERERQKAVEKANRKVGRFSGALDSRKNNKNNNS